MDKKTEVVTLTQINKYTTKKDGTPLMGKSKDGTMKPYTSVRIKTQEYGDRIFSGFGNKETDSWVVGSKVEIAIEQKGEYWNFSVPNKQDKLSHEIEVMKTTLGRMNMQLDVLWEERELRHGRGGVSTSVKNQTTGVDTFEDGSPVPEYPGEPADEVILD